MWGKVESYGLPRPLFVTLLLSRILTKGELRDASTLQLYCLARNRELLEVLTLQLYCLLRIGELLDALNEIRMRGTGRNYP